MDRVSVTCAIVESEMTALPSEGDQWNGRILAADAVNKSAHVSSFTHSEKILTKLSTAAVAQCTHRLRQHVHLLEIH